MVYEHESNEEVVSAVREYAKSVKNNSNVAEAMATLKDITSQIPLRHLDSWERLIRDAFSAEIEKKHKWFQFTQKERFLTWIDVFSWDGYKREKTLRTFAGPVPNSFFCAMILRRLNDWVPQVRAAAREKLPIIVDSTNPVFVVEAISSTLTSWKSWGRMKEPDKQALFSILANKHIFDTLLVHIVSSTSGPVMYLLSQCGRDKCIDGHLSHIAKNAIQPSVRAKAYRSQLDGVIKWQEGYEWKWTDKVYGIGRIIPTISERKISNEPAFEKTLYAASTDRSSVVRRVAAEFLIKDLDRLSADTALNYARRFKNDSSLPVSERGKFALKLLGTEL